MQMQSMQPYPCLQRRALGSKSSAQALRRLQSTRRMPALQTHAVITSSSGAVAELADEEKEAEFCGMEGACVAAMELQAICVFCCWLETGARHLLLLQFRDCTAS
jgi:hypothetical protein